MTKDMLTDGENWYPRKGCITLKSISLILLGIGIAFIVLACTEIMTLFTTQNFIWFNLKLACEFVLIFSIIGILTILIRRAIIILGNENKETKTKR